MIIDQLGSSASLVTNKEKGVRSLLGLYDGNREIRFVNERYRWLRSSFLPLDVSAEQCRLSESSLENNDREDREKERAD